jgi:DNA-binding NarL/FixJ family response regulator
MPEGTIDLERRPSWSELFAALSAPDRRATLEPDDAERLAMAAYLVGQEEASVDAWAQAHQGWLARDERIRAARCAFRLALRLTFRGETARAGGWVARGERLLDEAGPDCAEQGWRLLPAALRAALAGDGTSSRDAFARATALGERFADHDLTTLGRLGQGRTLIRLGEAGPGTALLDEVMVAVTAGEVSDDLVGDVYCAVIEACHEIYDLRRAQEWTAELTRWCESQPDLARYRGLCQIRRAELLQLHGEWPDALEEAERARSSLAGPPPRNGAGPASYELAELHRLRGELDEAEACYQQSHQWGHDPQPGLALLRLAQGRVSAAAVAMRRVMAEATDPRTRLSLLGACVEIMLAGGDLAAARAAAQELSAAADALGSALLHARAAHAFGAVLLAEGDARGAVTALREAAAAWRRLGVPYESARVRALTAEAHQALGDEESAAMELEAARQAFRELGAGLELARLATRPSPARESAQPGGPVTAAGRLTAREVEVLRVVATGATNRVVAARLGISEKTVARHVSNLLAKLGVSSRSAATSYAYRHGLLEPALPSGARPGARPT